MKSPLRRPISAERPLLILYSPSEIYAADERGIARLWEGIDPVVRDHATIQVEGTQSSDFANDERALRNAARVGIPITLQIQGDNGERHDTMPPDRIRRFLDTHDNIVGLQIVEASQRTFVNHGAGPEYTMGRNARYARDVIRIAGEHGLFMSFQLMRDNYAAIGCSADNEALFDTIVEYSDYVIPAHEMNSEFTKQLDHLAAMGMWVSGATQQWGIEAQSWYWSDNAYGEPGQCIPGSLEMPGGLYAIMFLFGAIGGATVYSIEPPQDIWPGPGGWRFTEHLAPVFRRLITERLIPSREDVVAASPVAYHLPRCNRPDEYGRVLDDLDFDHSEGRLLRATYGVFDRARDSEIVPNTPRYPLIPVLPTKTPRDVLDRFDLVLRPGDIESVEHARELVDPHFPPVDRGEAWSQSVGPLIVAANTHENWYAPESMRIAVPMKPDGLAWDEGTLSWNAHDGDVGYHVWRLREGVATRLTTTPLDEPRFSLDGAAAGDAHAVSAVTSATERLEGTLHLHDYMILSALESPRTPWFTAAGGATESARIGETLPGATDAVAERERRCAECTAVEDLASPVIALDDPHRETKRAVMRAMVEWKRAIEAEDVEAALGWYSPDYREPNGRTAESMRVALETLLWSRLRQRFGEIADEWGRIAAWRNPVVRMFVRNWDDVSRDRVVVSVVREMWAGAGSELEPSDMIKVPFGEPNETAMAWTRAGDSWRIATTDPPFLQAEHLVPFRYTYQGW